jgi:cytidylate kinase
MVLAFFGPTCSGKTSIAREVHRRHGIPVRHCGEAVKSFAAARGVRLSEMTIEDHVAIDSETRNMAEATNGALLIEGTFLDVVLQDVTQQVTMIRLCCSEAERINRFLHRRRGTEEDFRKREELDDNLRHLLYEGRAIRSDFLVADTTGMSVEQAAGEAWNMFKRSR